MFANSDWTRSMGVWELWRGDAAEWDSMLLSLGDYNVYQTHSWGEHRSRFGWIPARLTCVRDGEVIAAAQVLGRRYPLGLALAWIPGGPVGAQGEWGESFRKAVKSSLGAWFLYVRANFTCQLTLGSEQLLSDLGWRRPTKLMNSGLSLIYEPAVDEPTRLARVNRNWKRNLRNSEKVGNVARVWSRPDPSQVFAVYEAMQSHKQLGEQFSQDEIASIISRMGERCIVVRCDDSSGQLLALRAALIFGNKAWDIFAAATPEGRKACASYAAFWELMHQCQLRGINWYDLGGVDPVGNRGVYDFKKASGSHEFQYLGEWEWASFGPMSWLANVMLGRRV